MREKQIERLVLLKHIAGYTEDAHKEFDDLHESLTLSLE